MFLAVKTSATSVRALMSNSTIQGCRALAATVRPINEMRVDTMSSDYLCVICGQTAPSR
jgi:hypothetical protein